MNGRDLIVIDYVHVPPLLCLCEALGYRGKLCVFAGMTRQERLKLTGNKKRTNDHLQDGAECKQYQPIKDKFWTNEYFEFIASYVLLPLFLVAVVGKHINKH